LNYLLDKISSRFDDYPILLKKKLKIPDFLRSTIIDAFSINHGLIEAFHYDKTCEMISVRYNTPYRGDDGVTGRFRCRCGQTWDLKRTWRDKWYKCSNCSAQIYPVLQNFTGASTYRTHVYSNCQKCVELKHLCRYSSQEWSSVVGLEIRKLCASTRIIVCEHLVISTLPLQHPICSLSVLFWIVWLLIFAPALLTTPYSFR
jgi:hypothetical protein